jgi:hypothetical protein
VNTTAPAGPQRPSRGLIAAAVVLMLGVGMIIAVAFRGSWGALRDAALACHFERSAADLYPWGVDGLLIITVGALVLLRHDRGARRYCLGIIGAYTGASWLINYLHGLGRFTTDPVTHKTPVPPWPVVLVVASLVIGSIFLGSHLLVFVWRRIFPTAAPAAPLAPMYHFGPDPNHAGSDVPPPPADVMTAARDAYRYSRRPGMKELSQANLMDQFGISKRQAGSVQSAVKAEQAAPADVEQLAQAVNGPSQNGQGAS